MHSRNHININSSNIYFIFSLFSFCRFGSRTDALSGRSARRQRTCSAPQAPSSPPRGSPRSAWTAWTTACVASIRQTDAGPVWRRWARWARITWCRRRCRDRLCSRSSRPPRPWAVSASTTTAQCPHLWVTAWAPLRPTRLQCTPRLIASLPLVTRRCLIVVHPAAWRHPWLAACRR